MTRALRLLAALVALAAALPAPARAGDAPRFRRFALVAGANDGGPTRPRLRYAIADAERVAAVLQQVGGVAAGDTLVLLEPGEVALRAALSDLQERVARARSAGRTEVVFYYSGHSDEEGLLLRGSTVPYAFLRRWLDGLPADVRIAILDSCSSGAFTRGKGGVRAAPFLVDASSRVTGHAILTSSSADEASQESDRIGASFFTHYLVSGLRGAADTSLDRKVTLSEAYQFAFQETLARTERTRSGPQHPAWDIQLVGAGDVVLTDLRGTGAELVLPEAAEGRYFVRDRRERLVAELRKFAGRPVELALDPGPYRITREDGGRLVEARVALAQGARTELPDAGFTALAREATAARGDGAEELLRIPVDLAVFPPVSINGDRHTVNRLQLGLIASRTTRLRGVGIAPVLWADEDVKGVQLAYIGNSARGAVTGVQLSVVANVAGGFTGLQSTTGLNLVRGDLTGVQGSTFVNWTTGRLSGFQTATFVNYAGAVSGAQLAITSVAASVTGAQVGLVNVGGDVRGAQVGLVNVARTARGAQVGLVNVADRMEGVPFGLVPVVADGEHRFLVLANEAGHVSTGLLLGSRRWHSIFSAALEPGGGASRVWSGFGMGAHLGSPRLFADVDLLAQTVIDEDDHLLGSLRVLLGRRVGARAAVVAGPTANVFVSGGFDPGVGTGAGREWTSSSGNLTRLWLGLQAGLRI